MNSDEIKSVSVIAYSPLKILAYPGSWRWIATVTVGETAAMIEVRIEAVKINCFGKIVLIASGRIQHLNVLITLFGSISIRSFSGWISSLLYSLSYQLFGSIRNLWPSLARELLHTPSILISWQINVLFKKRITKSWSQKTRMRSVHSDY
jgi:hypothetical protein